MEQCTDWSAAIVAEMMVRGDVRIGSSGIETQVPVKPFVEELRKRSIEVIEKVIQLA